MAEPQKTYTKPEIWLLAKYLHSVFSSPDDWAVADKRGWYDRAREVHQQVYRFASPYVQDPYMPEIEQEIAELKGQEHG